ncbi:MAG: hypothetical protein RLZZ303_2395 [Candidatus Hydrogenedentota bacterium]|jgi:hypothetical protein
MNLWLLESTRNLFVSCAACLGEIPSAQGRGLYLAVLLLMGASMVTMGLLCWAALKIAGADSDGSGDPS